jgi:uncharacterized membrane protein YoaK (UPF0700 family)
MDISTLDRKKVKTVYIAIAALLAVGAIAAAYLHMQYVALALIVTASTVILIGGFLVYYLYQHEKIRDVD